MERLRTTAVRTSVAVAGGALALASAAWIVPDAWPTYAVFFGFAFAFSFVWLDSDAPTSVAHMAMATAFVYIAGFPVLFFELLARAVAYPVLFAGARAGWIALPRPLRPLVQEDRARARSARRDLAAMLGLATMGSAIRVAVVDVARAGGVESPIAMVALGEPAAYAVMGCLSAWLPLPTGDYVVAAPHRLPVEDERVDVIFSAVLIVPFLVLLIVYGYVEHGLVGAAAWSLTSLAPHGLVQLLIRRRHLLDRQRVALARKQAELEAFASTVAHDLKAPLHSISAAAARAVDADEAHFVATARRETPRILALAGESQQMLHALLRMIRIVSEPEPVELVDLNVVTAQALELLQPHVEARQVRVDIAAPLPAIPGQPMKLRHVIANLVDNAVRFVPAGAGVIDIGATREDGCVVLSVRDNGVGIPAGYHEEIFKMFRRAPNGEGGEAGSGMGLAIVKRIVEAHGGAVSVESAPGAGAAFRVRLPAR